MFCLRRFLPSASQRLLGTASGSFQATFSSSTISRIVQKLDEEVERFACRRLEERIHI
jgi:hypothetical protein